VRAETLALVGRFFAALNEGDAGRAADCLHDDAAHDRTPTERVIGREAFRWYLAARRRSVRETFADLAIMATDDGTRAAAEFTLRGERADGGRHSVNAGMFFSVSDGLIERITFCAMPPAGGAG
jgi:steroid delta-isomerase-like uncharacterized protein